MLFIDTTIQRGNGERAKIDHGYAIYESTTVRIELILNKLAGKTQNVTMRMSLGDAEKLANQILESIEDLRRIEAGILACRPR